MAAGLTPTCRSRGGRSSNQNRVVSTIIPPAVTAGIRNRISPPIVAPQVHHDARRCLSEIETLRHVLGFCPYSEALRNIHHYAVRSMLAEALKEVGFTVHQEVQGLAT
ncbi:hypothetical protein ANN_24835 [Periplaneta americana]|uniref:Uncharacterized protein n=1 Tax=Periplaneta americana TaxID=6978 RepID=A0ABQ8RZV0_PERAM|nr:hypothetical protein ANN_24835 [Periplaneta americana]